MHLANVYSFPFFCNFFFSHHCHLFVFLLQLPSPSIAATIVEVCFLTLVTCSLGFLGFVRQWAIVWFHLVFGNKLGQKGTILFAVVIFGVWWHCFVRILLFDFIRVLDILFQYFWKLNSFYMLLWDALSMAYFYHYW